MSNLVINCKQKAAYIMNLTIQDYVSYLVYPGAVQMKVDIRNQSFVNDPASDSNLLASDTLTLTRVAGSSNLDIKRGTKSIEFASYYRNNSTSTFPVWVFFTPLYDSPLTDKTIVSNMSSGDPLYMGRGVLVSPSGTPAFPGWEAAYQTAIYGDSLLNGRNFVWRFEPPTIEITNNLSVAVTVADTSITTTVDPPIQIAANTSQYWNRKVGGQIVPGPVTLYIQCSQNYAMTINGNLIFDGVASTSLKYLTTINFGDELIFNPR